MDFDPATQGLLAAAFQGLQSSGPSRMPMSLGQIIGGAGMAGLNEYQQAMTMAQKKKQAEMLMKLEEQKALREENAMKLDAQMRTELASAKNEDEAQKIVIKYAKPENILSTLTSSRDRAVHEKNAQATNMQRMQNQVQQYEQTYVLRQQAAKTDQEKLALAKEREAFHQQIQLEAQTRGGAEANYNFGYSPSALPTPTVTSGGLTGQPEPRQGGLLGGLPAAPPGFKTQESFSIGGKPVTDPTEIASIQAANANPGQTITDQRPQSGLFPDTPFGAKPAGLIAPVSNAPTSVIPAAPNNLDARDLMVRGAAPAPVVAPVAAPVAAPVKPAMPAMPPEIASAPKKVQDQWKIQQTRGSMAGAGTFTPETLEFTAKQYLKGDRQAAQGFARNATARIALQNAIVDEAKKQGISPEETAAKMAEFSGVVAGSRTVGQRAANISLAATEANEMLDIVKETSNKFGRTNFVPWNMALKAWESGTGEPEIAAFGASINALVNVYARAINPTGVPTISDKDHARVVLNQVQSPAQVDAVLGIIRRELDIAMKAPATVRAATRAGVVGDSAPAKGAGKYSLQTDEQIKKALGL